MILTFEALDYISVDEKKLFSLIREIRICGSKYHNPIHYSSNLNAGTCPLLVTTFPTR